MAKILLIISALVIAATAYLGFATKQKVDAIQGEFTEKKKAVSTLQADIGKAKAAAKKSEDEAVAAKADLDTKEKELAGKRTEMESAGSKLKEAEANLAARTEELDKLKVAIGAGPQGNTPDIEQLKRDFDEMKKSKAEMEVKVAELTQIKESMEKQVTQERSKATSAQSQIQAYKNDYTKPGVTGTILAYNPGWNFVVLSIGDRQSLKAGKEMVVTRDGQMIGKVRVTSVEPTTSIADIIPSTVAKGQSVQPGDRVVYETRTK